MKAPIPPCATCGAALGRRGQTFCSVACYTARQTTEPPSCAQCGGSMAGRRSGARFCCEACRSRSTKLRLGLVLSPEQRAALADKKRASVVSKAQAKKDRRQARMLEKRAAREAEAAAVLAARACSTCGKAHGMKGRRLCDPCRAAAERAQKRAERLRRKAAERSAMVETFDPFEVFARDGWRCQICGSTTPERLRGTMHKRAPELDHVVPLASGGEHTRTNTQCACRQCNSDKGAGRPIGQLPLFAADAPPSGGRGRVEREARC